MSKKSSTASKDPSQVVCRNRRARHDYDIIDELECGIVLQGSEVKSIRDNHVTIDEAYARVEEDEVWLINADIAEYPQASVYNHERKRNRKLLMSRREVRKFAEAAGKNGQTLVPLDVHFSRGLVKIQLALAKGRREHDKRDRIKKNEAQKQIRDAMSKRKRT